MFSFQAAWAGVALLRPSLRRAPREPGCGPRPGRAGRKFFTSQGVCAACLQELQPQGHFRPNSYLLAQHRDTGWLILPSDVSIPLTAQRLPAPTCSGSGHLLPASCLVQNYCCSNPRGTGLGVSGQGHILAVVSFPSFPSKIFHDRHLSIKTPTEDLL